MYTCNSSIQQGETTEHSWIKTKNKWERNIIKIQDYNVQIHGADSLNECTFQRLYITKTPFHQQEAEKTEEVTQKADLE